MKGVDKRVCVCVEIYDEESHGWLEGHTLCSLLILLLLLTTRRRRISSGGVVAARLDMISALFGDI